MKGTELGWLALALRSESDEPHEWWAVGWAVRNRVESKGYPNSYFSVITQAWQFSYFNQYRGLSGSEEMFAAALSGYAGDCEGWTENDYLEAVACAKEVMTASRWRSPFSIKVRHFWSPGAMNPPGASPTWTGGKRVFALPGIDPSRFMFAES